MTKEELEKEADCYAEKHAFRVPYDGSNKFYDDVDFKASKEAYLAGAKENGIQWHDLRKDPNDLPVLETELLCQKYSGRCFVGYYNHPDRKFFSHETRESYDIVRWADIGQFWRELLEGNETTFRCEIPPFDKE